MRITFLGTNGWYDTKTGNTNCVFVETNKYYLIFDAGNGIYQLDRYVKDDRPIYLFLGHLHLDHTSGFHILNKFALKQEVKIFVPAGTGKYLNLLVNPPFTVSLSKLPFKVKLHEVEEGSHRIPFKLTAKKIFHVDLCYGWRIELDNKIITYCVDTGICPACSYLAQQADILIHECSFKKPDPKLAAWGHTSPPEAAQLAKEAGVKKLVLTHFAADRFQTLEERDKAEEEAKKIFPNTIAAKDGLVINL